MSDWGTTQSEDVHNLPPADATPGATSAGSLLKAAREAQGLHIAALAVSLKVPVKKIEALEADRFEELPDAVFVRALAASVCRALKVDPTTILSKLPQTNAPRLQRQEQGINTPFRMPADGPSPISATALLKRPLAWGVMALLLGALILILLPDLPQKISGLGSDVVARFRGSAATAAPDAPSGAADVSNGTVMGAGTAVTSTLDNGAPLAQATMAVNAAGHAIKSTAALSTPTVASPTLVITPALGSVPDASATGDGVVVFKASGETWIEVSDARGKTTFKRVLQAGESAGASGNLPLQVTVGSADQTQVWVRGKPFEGGKVRNNVLRFEVR
ncbi:MAG: RodZ domain-containing protein [Burkholderiaceae bacterium]